MLFPYGNTGNGNRASNTLGEVPSPKKYFLPSEILLHRPVQEQGCFCSIRSDEIGFSYQRAHLVDEVPINWSIRFSPIPKDRVYHNQDPLPGPLLLDEMQYQIDLFVRPKETGINCIEAEVKEVPMFENLHQSIRAFFKVVVLKPICLCRQQGSGKGADFNSQNLKGGNNHGKGTLGVAAQIMESSTRWYHKIRLQHICKLCNICYTWPTEDSMLVYDYLSHLTIADDQFDILDFPQPSDEEIQKALSSMILSASGWRKIFAKSGEEEDSSKTVSYADGVIAAYVALALARKLGAPLAQKSAIQGKPLLASENSPTVLVGLDARPTGRPIGDIICRTLICLGCKVRYLFICAAPEIMADCNLYPEEADAFLYVSASHNPIGHNGFKFGKAGGVYGGTESKDLTNIFLSLFTEEGVLTYLQKLSASLADSRYFDVLNSVKREKQQSLDRYEEFILTTASKSSLAKDHYAFSRSVIANSESRPLGILGELNGSARSVSIDFSFLKSLGLKVTMINNKIGQVVHGIVPEGENLELCRETLEELYQEDKAYLLGYVPDNDGDRGNLVYIRESTGKAEILEAQNVFSLVVLAELCQAHLENPQAKLAIAVNGPTSMRIDRICEALNVEVFRSEVGEANVVELANMKRAQGYHVPILGEGSNGGNITHPAKVRDPMNTLMSLIKLMTQEELFKLWAKVSNTRIPTKVTLEAIIESLPRFITTPSFSDKGKMQVSSPQRALKQAYEELFLTEWEAREKELNSMGITDYKVCQMEGTNLYVGVGEDNRTEPFSGGYKIIFSDAKGKATDFIWMRGSKTEPVFRVLADCEGMDRERHNYLLEWQRSLIARADELAIVTPKPISH